MLPQGLRDSVTNIKCLVLVVEDDADTREALVAALEDSGFLIAQAANGSQALARLSSAPVPDVVLMDPGLPDCSGEELLARIRSAAPTARVLVLSGTTGTRLAALAAEAKVIGKPVDLDALEAAVAEACAA